MSCDFPVSDGLTDNLKMRFFAEINLLIVLVRLKCILLHYRKLPPKELIRHKFLKDEFSESNQR